MLLAQLFTICIVSLSGLPAVSVDPKLLDTLLKSAPTAWARQESSFKSFTLRCTLSTTLSGSPEKPYDGAEQEFEMTKHENNIFFARSKKRSYQLEQKKISPDSGSRSALIVNSTGSFLLRKDSSEQKFMLVGIGTDARASLNRLAPVERYLYSSWRAFSRNFKDLVRSDRFIINSISKKTDLLYSIEFQWNGETDGPSDDAKGCFIFDASNDWGLVDADVEFEWGRYTKHIEYEKADNTHEIIPKFVVEKEVRLAPDGTPATVTRLFKLAEWSSETPPLSAFSLESLGILGQAGEKKGITHPRLHYWFFGFSSLALLIHFLSAKTCISRFPPFPPFARRSP